MPAPQLRNTPRVLAASISAELKKRQAVAHIDFPAARCRLVIGKVRDSLIGLYFLSLARFVQRQRPEARTSTRKRRCRPIRRVSYLPFAFCRAFPLSTRAVDDSYSQKLSRARPLGHATKQQSRTRCCSVTPGLPIEFLEPHFSGSSAAAFCARRFDMATFSKQGYLEPIPERRTLDAYARASARKWRQQCEAE